MKRGTGIIWDPFCITKPRENIWRPHMLNKYIAFVVIIYSITDNRSVFLSVIQYTCSNK